MQERPLREYDPLGVCPALEESCSRVAEFQLQPFLSFLAFLLFLESGESKFDVSIFKKLLGQYIAFIRCSLVVPLFVRERSTQEFNHDSQANGHVCNACLRDSEALGVMS